MFKRLRTKLTFIMFATGLTPMIVMGVFCLYTDSYGIPNKLRDPLTAVPFLSSFVHEEVRLRITVCVLLALASGIAIGVSSILTARSITKPMRKARRMIEEVTNKGGPTHAFSDLQSFGHNEIGLLSRNIIDTVQEMRLKQDETEKELLTLQEKDRIKTEFISNITCDLRTPLTLILGPVTSLLEALPPRTVSEEDTTSLRMIRDNALKLKESVYSLVEFSSTEDGPSKAMRDEWGDTQHTALDTQHTALDTQHPSKHPIIVIEDDTDMKSYLCSVFKENFEPIFASSSDYGAMERIKESHVKLVIIDSDAAGREGYELCRKVKDIASPLFMPVVILTARGGTAMRIMGLEAGADCYITKPFEKRELLASLHTLSTQKELFDAIHDKNTQLHQSENVRAELVATMSHELRTPLSSILLASELLLDEVSGRINEEQRKQLGIIQLGCQNLLRLLNNVLSLSKINAGKMDVSLAEVDLTTLIDNVLKEISPLANQKELQLRSNICDIPPVISDGDKIRQVLLNILSNAIKFTAYGGIIEVSATIPSGLNMIEISITDTGIGIPQHAIDTIFEEYKQIKIAGKPNVEGVGLGLGITKKIVRLLGGEIWVKSKLGEGSVFSFALPQRIKEPGTTLDATHPTQSKGPQTPSHGNLFGT